MMDSVTAVTIYYRCLTSFRPTSKSPEHASSSLPIMTECGADGPCGFQGWHGLSASDSLDPKVAQTLI
ncbi:hypothetical protein TDB9533_00219 [Thalassocella blandensis]|nr:hypothetical protein TDB9533_00219 [Thalassocella blandensis]